VEEVENNKIDLNDVEEKAEKKAEKKVEDKIEKD